MPLPKSGGQPCGSASLWLLVVLSGLLVSSGLAQRKPGSRPRKTVSYYGHKEVQEGESFIVYCFADTRSKISWTKDGWPLRHWSPWRAYYVSEYVRQDFTISRLEVPAADADFSGGYSCTRESTTKHFVQVTAPREPARPQPACHVLVPGESVRLRCQAAGADGDKPNWFKDEQQLVPDNDRFLASNNTLEIRKAREQDAGAYGCSRGSQREANASLAITHVLQLVTPVRVEPVHATVDAPLGARIHLECRAYGRPEPRVGWLFNGGLSHVRSPLLSIENVSASQAGSYTCSASHQRCERLAAESDVAVNVFESTIRTNERFPGSGITLTPGDEQLRLKCDYPADRGAKIIWLKENVSVSGDKYTIDLRDQSLVINHPAAGDVGNYSCVALGKIVNETAVIVVGLKVAIVTSRSREFRAGKDGFLSCTVDGFPRPNVRWFRNGHLLNAYGSTKFKYGGPNGHDYGTIVIRRLNKRDDAVFTCVVDNGHSQGRAVFEIIVGAAQSPLMPFILVLAEVAFVTGVAYMYEKDNREALVAAFTKPRRESKREASLTAPEKALAAPKKALAAPEKAPKKKGCSDSDIFRFVHCVESSGGVSLDDLRHRRKSANLIPRADVDTDSKQETPLRDEQATPDMDNEPFVDFRPAQKTRRGTDSPEKKTKEKLISEEERRRRSSGAEWALKEKESAPEPLKDAATVFPPPDEEGGIGWAGGNRAGEPRRKSDGQTAPQAGEAMGQPRFQDSETSSMGAPIMERTKVVKKRRRLLRPGHDTVYEEVRRDSVFIPLQQRTDDSGVPGKGRASKDAQALGTGGFLFEDELSEWGSSLKGAAQHGKDAEIVGIGYDRSSLGGRTGEADMFGPPPGVEFIYDTMRQARLGRDKGKPKAESEYSLPLAEEELLAKWQTTRLLPPGLAELMLERDKPLGKKQLDDRREVDQHAGGFPVPPTHEPKHTESSEAGKRLPTVTRIIWRERGAQPTMPRHTAPQARKSCTESDVLKSISVVESSEDVVRDDLRYPRQSAGMTLQANEEASNPALPGLREYVFQKRPSDAFPMPPESVKAVSARTTVVGDYSDKTRPHAFLVTSKPASAVPAGATPVPEYADKKRPSEAFPAPYKPVRPAHAETTEAQEHARKKRPSDAFPLPYKPARLEHAGQAVVQEYADKKRPSDVFSVSSKPSRPAPAEITEVQEHAREKRPSDALPVSSKPARPVPAEMTEVQEYARKKRPSDAFPVSSKPARPVPAETTEVQEHARKKRPSDAFPAPYKPAKPVPVGETALLEYADKKKPSDAFSVPYKPARPVPAEATAIQKHAGKKRPSDAFPAPARPEPIREAALQKYADKKTHPDRFLVPYTPSQLVPAEVNVVQEYSDERPSGPFSPPSKPARCPPAGETAVEEYVDKTIVKDHGRSKPSSTLPRPIISPPSGLSPLPEERILRRDSTPGTGVKRGISGKDAEPKKRGSSSPRWKPEPTLTNTLPKTPFTKPSDTPRRGTPGSLKEERKYLGDIPPKKGTRDTRPSKALVGVESSRSYVVPSEPFSIEDTSLPVEWHGSLSPRGGAVSTAGARTKPHSEPRESSEEPMPLVVRGDESLAEPSEQTVIREATYPVSTVTESTIREKSVPGSALSGRTPSSSGSPGERQPRHATLLAHAPERALSELLENTPVEESSQRSEITLSPSWHESSDGTIVETAAHSTVQESSTRPEPSATESSLVERRRSEKQKVSPLEVMPVVRELEGSVDSFEEKRILYEGLDIPDYSSPVSVASRSEAPLPSQLFTSSVPSGSDGQSKEEYYYLYFPPFQFAIPARDVDGPKENFPQHKLGSRYKVPKKPRRTSRHPHRRMQDRTSSTTSPTRDVADDSGTSSVDGPSTSRGATERVHRGRHETEEDSRGNTRRRKRWKDDENDADKGHKKKRH